LNYFAIIIRILKIAKTGKKTKNVIIAVLTKSHPHVMAVKMEIFMLPSSCLPDAGRNASIW
jgi:hypothetical protein